MDLGIEAAEVARLELAAPAVELAAVEEAAPAAAAVEAAPSVPRLDQRARRQFWWACACLTTDVGMLLLAGIASSAAALAAGVDPLAPAWKAAVAVGVVAGLARRGLYRLPGSLRTLDHAASVLAAAAVSVASAIAVVALLELGARPVELLRYGVYAATYVAVGRLSFYRSHLRGRRDGDGLRPTLVVGAGRVGRIVADRLRRTPELGLLPVGYLDKNPLATETFDDLPVLGASWDLERVVDQHGIEQVVVCFSTAPDDVILRLVNRCEQLGVDVSVVPRLYEKTTTRFEVDHLGGVPLLHALPANPHGWQFAVKYALDRLVAALALVLLAPVLLLATAAVHRSLGRPILFRQARVGLDGKRFQILKFRSMRPGPADVPERERLTRVGALLRKTSIDELPQLLNVLRGDMSLIGPRPERPELAGGFEQSIYRYGERHRVKSGITGWAQVHGLGRGGDRFGNTSLRDRVEWDNFYIENWSLWLDLKIAVMTSLAILRFRQD